MKILSKSMPRCSQRPHAGSVRSLVFILVIAFGILPAAVATADGSPGPYSASALNGTYVWSGMLKFGAPIPIPALIVDGAPPHDQVSPGEVVGIWATILGTMTFDGAGNVTRFDDVVKSGEIVPLPPVPFEALPPFPETGSGVYSVSESGTVGIQLTGRDPSSPEGQVDFENDLHCVIQKRQQEMQCVIARFKTYFVDPNGYASPITGLITMKRQH
ncbi:hypothetical protein FV139_13950 [Parahaliea maris]|uniref:Uncharacterized protein n=1 Tax=Parahaliea maris TaxID=2716870 RepID=A0A5C8ZX51_9GAMM|nr:hypothetical protein [Parahaliea maris]TXS93046.1 hypothetical protein FV139_13950 [Parahaliea maris]